MEHPNYGEQPVICSSEEVLFLCLKQYLERAQLALADVGSVYMPTKAEMKVAEFQENIKYISSVSFDIVEDNEFRIFLAEIREDDVKVTSSKFNEEDNVRSIDKEDFIYKLQYWGLKEWRSYYDPRKFGEEFIAHYSWGIPLIILMD